MGERKTLLFGVGIAALVAVLVASLMGYSGNDRETQGAMGGRGSEKAVQGQRGAIPFETLGHSISGPWRGRMETLATTVGDWDLAMQDCLRDGRLSVMSAPTAPEADWDKNVVVLVSLGMQRTSGYSIEVVRARREKKELVVEVDVVVPGSMANQVITAPYHLVQLPRRGTESLRVEYSWRASGLLIQDMSVLFDDQETTETTWGSLKQKYTTP